MDSDNSEPVLQNDVTMKTIPEPSLRRLPKYLHYLKMLHAKDREYISCTHLSATLAVDPTLVRKDLAFTGIKGKPKSGYSVEGLIGAIENFLNLRNNKDAFLAGAGHLGTALIGYRGFEPYGLKIVAAFDNNPDKIGKEIHGVQVLNIDKLSGLMRRMNIRLGIITTPASATLEVAGKMIEGGVKAIWNFSPTELVLKNNVAVINENLASSLAVLSHKIK